MRFGMRLLALLLSVAMVPSVPQAQISLYGDAVRRYKRGDAGNRWGFRPGNSGDLRYGLLRAMNTGGENSISLVCSAPPCTITLSAPLPPIFESATSGVRSVGVFSLAIDFDGASV